MAEHMKDWHRLGRFLEIGADRACREARDERDRQVSAREPLGHDSRTDHSGRKKERAQTFRGDPLKHDSRLPLPLAAVQSRAVSRAASFGPETRSAAR